MQVKILGLLLLLNRNSVCTRLFTTALSIIFKLELEVASVFLRQMPNVVDLRGLP
jgi:hypothetical protein